MRPTLTASHWVYGMQFSALTFHTIESGPDARAVEAMDFSPFLLDPEQHKGPGVGLAPIAGDAEDLSVCIDGATILRFAVSQRDVPKSLQASALRRAVSRETERLGHAPADHELSELRGRVLSDLYERALPKVRSVYAGIDPDCKFWWIATPSGDLGQRFIGLMTRVFDTCLASTTLTLPAIEAVMTRWVLDDALPDPLEFGTAADVTDVDTQMKVSVRNGDVTSATVVEPLTPESRVLSRLALRFGADVSFTLTPPLVLHRLRLGAIPASATDNTLTDAQTAWSEWIPRLRALYELFAALHAQAVGMPAPTGAARQFLPEIFPE